MKVYKNGRELVIAKDPGTRKWGKFQPRKPQGHDPEDEAAYEDFKQGVVRDFEESWNDFIESRELPRISGLHEFFHKDFVKGFNDHLPSSMAAETESMRSADFYGWLIDLEAR